MLEPASSAGLPVQPAVEQAINLEPGLLDLCNEKKVPMDLRQWLSDQGLVSIELVANAVEEAGQVDSALLVGTSWATKVAKVATMKVLWRRARDSVKVTESRAEDMEAPVEATLVKSWNDKFKARYGFELDLEERLCEPLLGILKRDIERELFSNMRLERVRNAREVSRLDLPKEDRLSEKVTLVHKEVGQVLTELERIPDTSSESSHHSRYRKSRMAWYTLYIVSL